MATLWEFVDSLDSIDESDKDQYEKFGDGYRRKVEVEDVTGLKSALQKERDARKKYEREIAKFKDIDPEKYRELLKKYDDGGSELEKLQRRLAKLEDEANGYKTEAEKARDELKRTRLRSEARKAALAAGVLPEDVDDVLILTENRLSLDDKGRVIVVDADGDPTGKTADDFFAKDFKEAKPKFYKGLGGGSGTGSGSSGSGGTKTIKRAEFDALDPVEQHAKIKAGFVPVD